MLQGIAIRQSDIMFPPGCWPTLEILWGHLLLPRVSWYFAAMTDPACLSAATEVVLWQLVLAFQQRPCLTPPQVPPVLATSQQEPRQ